MSDCQCPTDWPRSLERDFERYADQIADLNGIPHPRFWVTAHVAPCQLPDVPHTIPDDYAAPGYEWDAAATPANTDKESA